MMLNDSVEVIVSPSWLEEHSAPDEDMYAFAYDITIHNRGSQAVKLVSRHWFITDSDGNEQEVKGQGVMGKQPVIQPDESYHYSSGVALKTPLGSMYGYYVMQADDNTLFQADIPAFTLVIPGILH